MISKLSVQQLEGLLKDKYIPTSWRTRIAKELEIRKDSDPLKNYCYHNWREVISFSNVYYNCKTCGIKKEDYERDRKPRQINEERIGQSRRGATD